MAIFQEKLKQYLLLMRADRPVGSFLLLWPTLWSLWLAAQVYTLMRFAMGEMSCQIWMKS